MGYLVSYIGQRDSYERIEITVEQKSDGDTICN